MVSEISRPHEEAIMEGPKFSPYSGLKRRIAVLSFENRAEIGGDKIGSAVADMVVRVLVKSGRFTVLERTEVERLLNEQALGQTGAVTEESAPKVGRLLGVQGLVVGRVEELRLESGKKNIESKKEDKWRLVLQATAGLAHLRFRVLDALTGEVVLSDEVQKFEIRPGFGLKTEEYEFKDLHQFDQTLLGLVCREAANEAGAMIAAGIERLEWFGKVVKVAGDSVLYFTPGKNDGIQLADRFVIWGAALDSTQKVTPDSTDLEEKIKQEQIGTVEVIDFIGERVSKAMIISGQNIRRGDLVKMVQ